MKRIFTLALMLGFASLTYGQQGETAATGDTKTVEDVYLQSTVEVQVVKTLAAELSRDAKRQALGVIRDMVDNGRAKGNLEVISVLKDLSGEGVSRMVRVNGRLMNDYPEIRREAAELLGQVGGEISRNVLIEMAMQDQEPMVLAEAVYSLGLIEPDDTGRVEALISSLIRTQDAVRPDNNFAYAAISALENIGKNKSGKVNPEVFVSLIQIAQGNYIRAVREKANKVLNDFRKL